MKKLLFFVLAFFALFISCTNTDNKQNQNPTQQELFSNFLMLEESEYLKEPNKIAQNEYKKKFERRLYNYVDSFIGIITNWKGTIKNINSIEERNTTGVKFEIVSSIREYQEITFVAFYPLPTDSLNIDPVYNSVKEMYEGQTVYFDGLISTKSNQEVNYYMSSLFENHFSYPHYYFWVVDVRPYSDTIGIRLKKEIELCRNINRPLELNYKGRLPKEKADSIFNKLLPEYKNTINKLPLKEQKYISRLGTAITYNYLYSDDLW